MKRNKLFLLVTMAFILGSSLELSAQVSVVSDTIKWTGNPYIDVSQDSSHYQNYSQFITYGNQKIRWILFSKPDQNRKSTSKNLIFQVTGMEGSWPDVTTDGHILYYVKLQGNQGIFRIKRSGPACVIHIEWTDKKGRTHSLDFEVSNFQIV